jgi:bifunctional non-homologous end joining protein LigD
VIAGFTKPAGSRDYLEPRQEGKSKEGLKYGHTGSGFTDKMLKEVYEKLKPLITNNLAFKEIVKKKQICRLHG